MGASRRCRGCGAAVERPGQLVCRSCLAPLALTGALGHGAAETPTVRERPVRGLRLEFGVGVVR
ncbi:hypothetical protein, partial [Streptomyces sp. NPDC006193]|uniref:hypothetical protein n=1 Tax=Streptomyces sp. NPDC006193 TaxID=3155717 RepID=UPI0033B9A75E